MGKTNSKNDSAKVNQNANSDRSNAREFNFKKGIKMRLLLSNFLATAFSFYFLLLAIKGDVIHVAGICAGIIVGFLGAIFTLVHLERRARKQKFTIVARNPKMRVLVMFFIIIPIVTVFAVLILLRLKHNFPQINWANIWITFLVVALAVYSLIYMVGLYRLERRYGKKFYLVRGR
jgi:hypothetical protein